MVSFLVRPLVVALGIAALVVAVIAWIMISPLFINKTVSESFPSIDAVMQMTDAEKAEIKDDMIAAAAEEVDVSAADPMPTGPVLLASGAFADADAFHQGSGDVSLYNLDGERVIRFEDFKGTNGPDLFVWLTNVDDPRADKGSIAQEGNWVSLGRLKGNVGDQNYSVPADVDLSDFNHIVVWCRAFGVLFSAATLQDV